jgi:hypothetical protein
MSEKTININGLRGVRLAQACAEAMGWECGNATATGGTTITRPAGPWGKDWMPHLDANHAREMVGLLSNAEIVRFNQAIRDRVGGELDPSPWAAFMFDLPEVCRAFLRAKGPQ